MPVVRVAVAAVAASLALAVPALAQDPAPTPVPTQEPTPVPEPTPAPDPVIAAGVSVAGVDVSGLTIPKATATLRKAFTKPLKAPVVVSVAGVQATLTAKQAKVAYDPERTARRAFHAGLAAKGAPVDVRPAVTSRRAPVRDFAEALGARVLLPARDATIRITLTRMVRRSARDGRRLPVKALRAKIERALADPRRPRVIKPGRVPLKPKVGAAQLAKRYPTVLTVDKRNFRLRLFKRLKLVKTYGIAIGQPAYPTPSGLFSIVNKAVNPTWTAPNSPWAGEMAGQSISGNDPNNPLKARWMGIVNGVGIHGTGQEWSVGSAASHGCIRMRVADVIDLYDRVPVGTPVLIR
jgi:lipoprotein-anchoring transpeptidase ErfK/SrfK